MEVLLILRYENPNIIKLTVYDNWNKALNFKNAKRASEAAAPLATWVTTNTKYAAILEKIQPLEREQQELQRLKNFAEVIYVFMILCLYQLSVYIHKTVSFYFQGLSYICNQNFQFLAFGKLFICYIY